MKILFVAPRFHTNQCEWVHALRCAGHEVTFHALLRGKTENYSEIEPIVVTPSRFSTWLMVRCGTGGENLVRGFPRPIPYFRDLLALRPDIMVVRDIGRWFSALAATIGRILDVRIVIYSQTPLFKHYSPLRRLVTWVILKTFKACWMTPIMGDKTIRARPPLNMFYVPFSVPIRIPKQILHTKKTRPPLRIISIGKFDPRKNHRLLLRALKRLQVEGYEFLVTLIGEVSKPHHIQEHALVLDEIANLALGDVVTVSANVNHQEISGNYANSDLFVLPATAEPASISVLEALGHGLPVICSDTCGTRWYVKNGVTGFIFKDNSLSDLEAVLRKSFDRELLEQMKMASGETARREIASSAFIAAFDKMLKRRFAV